MDRTATRYDCDVWPYYTGVTAQNVSKELADAFNFDKVFGALIAYPIPDSPAELVGLARGDIVLSVNGINIRNSTHFTRLLHSVYQSDKLRLVVRRNTKDLTIFVDRRFITEIDRANVKRANAHYNTQLLN